MLSHVEFLPGFFQIADEEENCASLLVGKERALLFDTLLGNTNIAEYVSGLTDKPVIVVNSHAHLDHVGGNTQFSQVYMSQVEIELSHKLLQLVEASPEERKKKLAPAMESLRCLPEMAIPLFIGDRFAIGGITLVVVDLRGHTPGSVGLLWEEEKILFSGDALMPNATLFFPESLSLREYEETLLRAEALDFTYFVTGHKQKMYPKSLLDKLKECVNLPERKKGVRFNYSIVPEYVGVAYVLEFNNPDAEGTISISLKE